MFSLGETNEGSGKVIWNQAWHGVNIKSCEVMVLVQLFIIRIALSNWAAPSYPFFFVIISHSSPLLCHKEHTHTVVMWMADCIIIIQWTVYLPYTAISHSCSLNASSWNAIKSDRNAPSFPFDCQMFIPSLHNCTGFLLELNCFSHFLKFIHLSHRPPPSFSTLPPLNFLISPSRSGPTWAGGAR